MRCNIHVKTIARIKAEYAKESSPWLLAYSGGKDSSAVLALLVQAMNSTTQLHRPVYVVFCDTGVENPVINNFVRYAFQQVNVFAKCNNLPVSTSILRPKKKDRYWVKVIGKGCPPPTNRFRWCTDKLRVNPLHDFCIKNELTSATTVLGIRKGESHQRDRTIEKYAKKSNFLRYYDSGNRLYYCPIFNYSCADVWNCLSNNPIFSNRLYSRLARIYGINNKCEDEIVKSNDYRMGCWVCTVIRKDKSAEDLIKRGYTQLEPYLRFRDWLSIFRDNPRYRCAKRRNGLKGPGPFTIKGRKIILSKLLKLQNEVKAKLIADSDLACIYREWERDTVR
jgi:DNA sulfur modification protein DndC